MSLKYPIRAGAILVALMVLRGCNKGAPAAPQSDSGLSDAAPDLSILLGGSGGAWDGGMGGSYAPGGSQYGLGGGGTEVNPIPRDWEAYTKYSENCPVYIPGAKGKMPPPIEWEPCPNEGIQNADCRIMKLSAGGTSFIFGTPKFTIHPTAGPMLEFIRGHLGGSKTTHMQIVAEIDGPVRNAFLMVQDRIPRCGFQSEALRGDRYAISMNGERVNDPLDSSVQGLLAGRVGEPYPDYVTKLYNGTSFPSNWDVNSEWILRKSTTYTATTWDESKTELIYDPSQVPYGLAPHQTEMVGADIFINTNGGGRAGVMSWSPIHGIRPLLSWPGNPDKAAGSFGTDGKDMVWTFGEGQLGEFEYEKLSLMTAPYTTEPEEVQSKQRRLRSATVTFLPDRVKVGCGCAVRHAKPSEKAWGVLVVRLADGWSWMILGKDPEHYPMTPLGMTCDEVFVSTQQSMARVRLDSLGEGMPPD